jgi:catechol 2,3-dioxygenase-like lactoylglutathione lyase family enzyme
MRRIGTLVTGIVIGLVVQSAVAQKRTEMYVNHVGIAVPSVPDALAYYTQKMGFREAFRNTNDQGQPTAIYLQISKNTFLELQQANAQRPAGLNHFGLEVPDIKAAVATFRQHGATASDPTGPSAFSKAMLANVTDLNGLRIELAELGPDSLQRKASESWK